MGGYKVTGLNLAALSVAGLGLSAPSLAHDQATPVATATIISATPRSAAPDLFGTVALAAPADRTAVRWQRVSGTVPISSILELVEPVRGLKQARQLLFVQSVVQRTLAYRDDRQMWGEEDYWATADETMARGGGDCEDLAIVKYQALRALGFAPEALVLSIGRDHKRGDHALLLVRLDEKWWVLDDNASRPLLPDQRPDFEPMMSFSGASMQWLHGRARPGGAVTRAAARR